MAKSCTTLLYSVLCFFIIIHFIDPVVLVVAIIYCICLLTFKCSQSILLVRYLNNVFYFCSHWFQFLWFLFTSHHHIVLYKCWSKWRSMNHMMVNTFIVSEFLIWIYLLKFFFTVCNSYILIKYATKLIWVTDMTR